MSVTYRIVQLDCEKLAAKAADELISGVKWDLRFLELAKLVSTWSKDPSTQVGAVVVDKEKRVVSLGYNGLPKNVQDSEERLNDRDLKLKLIIHAELNAIQFARQNLSGCTLYTHPFMPCSVCASHVIQSGITRVVSLLEPKESKWAESILLSNKIFKESGVEVCLY